jgi:hypothetical protein
MKNIFILSSLLFLVGCAKDDITVYNNYNGTPVDSTGYINIFYHNFEPDIILDSSSLVRGSGQIDFNNDDENDFSFGWDRNRQQMFIEGLQRIIAEKSCHKLDTSFNIVVEKAIPSALDSGFLVQSILDINYHHWLTGLLSSSVQTKSYFESSPCSLFGKEFFIGMKSDKVLTTSNTNYSFNYGWMRIAVSSDGKSITLKDYAYNIIPSSPIRIGDK